MNQILQTPIYQSQWTVSNFLFNSTCSLVASFVFLFVVLKWLKPRIRIADFICKTPETGDSNVYVFKFKNNSFIDAFDVKVELFEIERHIMGNGTYNKNNKKLTLFHDYISLMPGRSIIKKSDGMHNDCITVRTIENIEEILSVSTKGIALRISLKHGLTGLTNVLEQEFGSKESIKSGKFKSGREFATL